VAGAEPATDADLDTARALLVAARRFREPAYREAGLRMGRAVLEAETTEAAGKLVLVAGPWARAEARINPSYFSPRAYRELGAASGDGRWGRLAASSRRLTDRLTAEPPHLAPDWAQVHAWGVVPTGPPGSPGEPAHGYDAVRVPLRLAESCAAADRALAARGEPSGAPVRGLDGTVRADGEHPAALVGAAATAGGRERADLLNRAEQLDEDHPSYYGAALVALGRTMLETRLLGGCGQT
jgi:endoglucanase